MAALFALDVAELWVAVLCDLGGFATWLEPEACVRLVLMVWDRESASEGAALSRASPSVASPRRVCVGGCDSR